MKKTSYPLALLAVLTLFSSCRKFIEQQEKNAVLSIMTNGYWKVAGYKQNDSDLTAAFSGYLFKFDENYTVTGTLANVSTKGQWSANVTNRTIVANFPGAAAPLELLNATWTIRDSYTDSVSARTIDTVHQTLNILQLKKQ
jgi:hypothetical protein